MNDFTKNRYQELKNVEESFKVRYHAFKVIYQYLDFHQREFLKELVKKSEGREFNALRWIEAYNAIDPNREFTLTLEMLEFERQRLLDELPEKIRFEAKYNLLSKLKNS